MTAKIEFQNDISIITLDDGKANVFSQVMLESLYECLSKVHKDKGCLVITGRKGMFSAGFDLKTFASGDKEKIAIFSLSPDANVFRSNPAENIPFLPVITRHPLSLCTLLKHS